MTSGRVTNLVLVLVLIVVALTIGAANVLAQDAATDPTAPPDVAQAYVPDGKVRAVLFYSTSCPHCHTTMHEDLPPIQEIFGDQLEIVYLNVSKDYADLLYDITNATFGLKHLDQGVPMMVIGEHYMVGGGDIRTNFPPLVASYLEQGGVDWPAIPGLHDVIGMQEAVESLTEQPPSDAPTAAPQAPPAAPALPVYGAPGVGPTPRPASPVPDESRDAGTGDDSGASGGSTAGEAEAEDDDSGAGATSEDEQPAAAATAEDESSAAGASDGDSPVGPSDAAATSAALALAGVEAMPTLPASAFAPPEDLSVGERYMLDPTGNTMSVIVLLLMLVSLVAALRPAGWQRTLAASKWPGILIPVLAIAGIIVAGYLAYVETTLSEAYCGPVGDCNAVQQSDYARLFGIPIAWLGLMGYLAVLGLWVVTRRASEATARWAWAFLFVVAIVGVLSSMYLTFLEPFVIGATCAWCLTSAVLMTAILLLSAGRGHEALRSEPPPEVAASA